MKHETQGSFRLLAIVSCVFLAMPLMAQNDSRPVLLRNVEFEQKLNAQLPLDASFRDEDGRTVGLRTYFGRKPVILSFAYYDCPMLCTLILDGLTRGLQLVPFNMGEQFEAVNISINPREPPSLARAKKENYAIKYGRPGAAAGWHFLTGDETSIRRVADAAGFKYESDPASGQYAHASGILIATPTGKISRYFYGIVFQPRDLRLGLVEASSEKIGSPADMLLLYCYHYDATTGKYSLLVTRVVRLSGIATVLLLGGTLLLLFRREARRQKPEDRRKKTERKNLGHEV